MVPAGVSPVGWVGSNVGALPDANSLTESSVQITRRVGVRNCGLFCLGPLGLVPWMSFAKVASIK